MPACPAQISGAHIPYLLLCTSTESDPQSGISPLPLLSSCHSKDSNKSREPTIPYFRRKSLDLPDSQKTLPEIPVSPIPPRSPLHPNPSQASLMSTQTDSTNALFLIGQSDICTVLQYCAHNHHKCHLNYPTAESPFARSDANLHLFTQSQDEYQTPLMEFSCTSRRQL